MLDNYQRRRMQKQETASYWTGIIGCMIQKKTRTTIFDELPEGSAPNGSWSVQDLGHRSHEAVEQQGQFGAAILPLHYSETGRTSLVHHWRSHQTELPRELANSGSPWSSPIQTQEQRIQKVNCKKHICVLNPKKKQILLIQIESCYR